MSLDNIIAEQKKMMEKIRATGKDEFMKWFKTYFENYPIVKAVSWSQWTPHFNDGEPCEFSTHNPQLYVHPENVALFTELGLYIGDEDDENDDDEDEDTEQNSKLVGIEVDWKLKCSESELTTFPAQAALKFKDLFEAPDEIFQAAFGDGVKVVITPEDVTVEEVDHD